MLANISKWGNSLGVRIPSTIAKQVGIAEGDTVEVTVENNHIIIQKIYRLDSLLARITPENLHSEVVTDTSVVGKIW